MNQLFVVIGQATLHHSASMSAVLFCLTTLSNHSILYSNCLGELVVSVCLFTETHLGLSRTQTMLTLRKSDIFSAYHNAKECNNYAAQTIHESETITVSLCK